MDFVKLFPGGMHRDSGTLALFLPSSVRLGRWHRFCCKGGLQVGGALNSTRTGAPALLSVVWASGLRETEGQGKGTESGSGGRHHALGKSW